MHLPETSSGDLFQSAISNFNLLFAFFRAFLFSFPKRSHCSSRMKEEQNEESTSQQKQQIEKLIFVRKSPKKSHYQLQSHFPRKNAQNFNFFKIIRSKQLLQQENQLKKILYFSDVLFYYSL
eukprot:GDKK01012571.1.p1 GENE.GDKK01012571.1~~GDKK01012571.1.p1  ORF type:complete len:122 (-),score=27.70 GDKK01012571.1:128-493(-)